MVQENPWEATMTIFKGSVVIALSWAAATTAFALDGTVWRAPSCGCCEKWAAHMRDNGYQLKIVDLPRAELDRKKAKLGVGGKHASCHTAEIDGYVVEGHVPASEVKRLLEQRPDAVGLSVPDMPAGSPGMETEGAHEPFDVLLVNKDGSSEIFARYGSTEAPVKAD
jgi:hypothetical protein